MLLVQPDNQRKIAQLIIARLDGGDIIRKYDYYRNDKGILEFKGLGRYGIAKR